MCQCFFVTLKMSRAIGETSRSVKSVRFSGLGSECPVYSDFVKSNIKSLKFLKSLKNCQDGLGLV